MISLGQNGMIVVAAALLFFSAQGLAAFGAEPAKAPQVDAAMLARLVQSFDKVEKQEYPWGWIRWLMNADLDPQSTMTLGVVEVRAGQSNPAHGNCDEILYVLSGSCEHRVGNEVVVLKAGDVMRIPAGVPHSAKTFDQPMRAVVVYNTGRREFTVVEDDGAGDRPKTPTP